MKKIAFVLACILTISICLAGCQETEFDTGEGTPVFSLDANEISAVTFQNGNTGEKTIVSNRDEITEIADYLNAFRYTETQSVRGGDGWSSRIIIDFNEGESISFYSLEAGKIIMDDTEYEAGAQAAGLYRCWSETDRVEGLDGSGEGSADGDRSAA